MVTGEAFFLLGGVGQHPPVLGDLDLHRLLVNSCFGEEFVGTFMKGFEYVRPADFLELGFGRGSDDDFAVLVVHEIPENESGHGEGLAYGVSCHAEGCL